MIIPLVLTFVCIQGITIDMFPDLTQTMFLIIFSDSVLVRSFVVCIAIKPCFGLV